MAICNLQFAICNLQIADCKLQIANCNLQFAICNLQTAGARPLLAIFDRGFRLVRCRPTRMRRRCCVRQFAICNLQFAIRNLQSAICNLPCPHRGAVRSTANCKSQIANRRLRAPAQLPPRKTPAAQQERARASSLLTGAFATGFQRRARRGRGGEERGGAGTDAWRLSCQVLHKRTIA